MDSQRNLHCGIRKVYEPIYQDSSEEPIGVECLQNTAVDVFDDSETLLQYPTPDVAEDFKRNGCHQFAAAREDDDPVDRTNDSKYIPAKHLCPEIFEAFAKESDPSHLDFEYFFGLGGADDDFDDEWERYEQIVRAEALEEAENAANTTE